VIVTGSPITAYVDAIRTVLLADTTLMALVTGLYGHLPDASRTEPPYLVIGRRHRDNDGGAMQIAGGRVTVDVDGWSGAKGPFEMQRILSRVAYLLERRRTLAVSGFAYLEGSLTCEMEDVFDEPDEDKPESGVYHGVQRWTADIHESS
jgi:hypothetical protein